MKSNQPQKTTKKLLKFKRKMYKSVKKTDSFNGIVVFSVNQYLNTEEDSTDIKLFITTNNN